MTITYYAGDKHLKNLSNICTLLYSDLNELHAELLDAKGNDFARAHLQFDFDQLLTEFEATSRAWDAAHIHECDLETWVTLDPKNIDAKRRHNCDQ